MFIKINNYENSINNTAYICKRYYHFMKQPIMKFLFFSISLLFMACNNGNDQPKKESTAIEATVATEPGEGAAILQLDERLKDADSMVFVFYKDPHGKDSLRYTRYYSEYHSTDTGIIHLVKDNLTDSTQRLEKIKNCRSEGKIWCFAKGNVFQTIYFSAHNKDCSFVYIIKNGQFYYSDISNNLVNQLAALKPLAKASINEGE